MPPRNKPGYLARLVVQAAIRDILADLHCPCCGRSPLACRQWRPTATRVKAWLPPDLDRSERRVRALIQRVLDEERSVAEK